MSKRRRKGKKRELDPIDVLEGRDRVSVAELIALVHQVNPTQLDLPPDEKARRYEVKTALQSLLLREYREELSVVQDGDVIAIHHRYGAGDACHAVVDELEEDVRSWVRRLLDEEAEGEPDDEPEQMENVAPSEDDKPSQDRESLLPDELLREGDVALEGWDYDRACACFTLAHRRSGGSLQTAKSLLGILVDYLAQDHDALDLDLSTEAASDESVRSFIAVAAARVGDFERLERVVRGLKTERAAEACVTAAEEAVKAGDEYQARHWVEEADHRGASAGDIARLTDAIAALRASKRAPMEQQTQDALDAGDTEKAERLAKELQHRWPESGVARKILAFIEQRAKFSRLEVILRRAEEARAEGHDPQETRLLREALTLGAGEKVRRRLSELDSAARKKADDGAVAHALELFCGDLGPALVAYLELRDDLRQKVRSERPLPALEWLEELGAGSKIKARAAVEAVLALVDAQEALSRGEGSLVGPLLDPHERVLRGVSETTKVQAEAAAQLERERAQEALEALEEARAAFARGDLELAQKHLSRADRGLLDADWLTDLQRLKKELSRTREIRRLEAAVSEAEDDLLHQRELVKQLVDLTDGEAQAGWRQHHDELAAKIREIWRIEVIEGKEAQKIGLIAATPHRSLDSVETWLLPDGKELVLAVPLAEWLFIWIVGIDDQTIRTVVSLRTPRPLGAITTVVVDAPTLIVAGEKGDLLRLSLDTWDVLEWRSLQDFYSKDEIFEYVYPLPGTRYLWFCTSHRRDKVYNHPRIVDLSSWRVHRDLGEVFTVEPVGGEEQMVLVVTNRESGRLLGPNGSYLEREIPDGVPITSVAPDPSGQGVVLLSHDPALEAEEEEEEAPLHLVAVGPNPTKPLVVEDTHYECGHSLATASEQGLIFVAFDDVESLELTALHRQGERFEQVYQVSAPRETTMVGDKDRQHVACASWEPMEGLSLIPLGAEAPVLPQPSPYSARLPHLGGSTFCHYRYGDDASQYPIMLDRLRAMRPGERRAKVEEYRRRGEPRQMLDLVQAMRYLDEFDHLDEARRLHERYTEDPAVALLRAVMEAEAGNWSQCREVLESGSADGLPESAQQHRLHLLGLARFHAGDLAGAKNTWEEGLELEGGCELEPLLSLVTAAEGDDGLLLQKLITTIRVADEHLDAGRPDRVLEVLRLPWIFQLRELQGLARLAEAHLLLETESQQARFHKVVALAAFSEAYEERDNAYRNHLELPGLTWSRERIDGLHDRVRPWLDRRGSS